MTARLCVSLFYIQIFVVSDIIRYCGALVCGSSNAHEFLFKLEQYHRTVCYMFKYKEYGTSKSKTSLAMQVLTSKQVLGKDFKVYGTIENPLFLAKDVAKMIDVNNISDLMSRIDDDEKQLINTIGLTDSIQGNPNKWFLSEDGLYEVFLQSTNTKSDGNGTI